MVLRGCVDFNSEEILVKKILIQTIELKYFVTITIDYYIVINIIIHIFIYLFSHIC